MNANLNVTSIHIGYRNLFEFLHLNFKSCNVLIILKKKIKKIKKSNKIASLRIIYSVNYIILNQWEMLENDLCFKFFELDLTLSGNSYRQRFAKLRFCDYCYGWFKTQPLKNKTWTGWIRAENEASKASMYISTTHETIKQCNKISPRANWPNKIVVGI